MTLQYFMFRLQAVACCRFLDSGGVYKLAFGPKAFIVVSDPVVVRHLLKVISLHCAVGCQALDCAPAPFPSLALHNSGSIVPFCWWGSLGRRGWGSGRGGWGPAQGSASERQGFRFQSDPVTEPWTWATHP